MRRATELRRLLRNVNARAWSLQCNGHGPAAHLQLGWTEHLPQGPSTSNRASLNTSTASAAEPANQQKVAPSIDKKEAEKFAALASQWWDPAGPFAPLHRFNPARCKFIRDATCAMQGLDYQQGEPLAGLHVLDVGCGGGILSESMARLGAQVHGIDITEENTRVASQHAALDPLLQSRIRYECTPVEALAGAEIQGTSHLDAAAQRPEHEQQGQQQGQQQQQQQEEQPPPQLYNLVLASEVLEHVKRPDRFCGTLAKLAAPGGTVIISTLNRTPASFALGIVGAEYITRVVPRGTHQWDRFITPEELVIMASEAGLTLSHMAGIQLQPRMPGSFALTDDTSVNYIAAFYKP
uniref:Ubiquinone biosynthesis O-methyltransferase, mitochondrial n=1 Tax=Dunaliella tertiolecta TaxID=3047 RepID=A0A6S8HAY4_DUNTE|mmetsp:Transcript_22580/g.58954  ORF Transcript_22580/g.58954 Transcript_22580/m.58954 type:complete len:352 (-) Transcript_22580:148-1203(-)|eukprot:CAMPEP_0202375948 /NCGR_PEP_ID=MMETSP1127-20130417/6544_1 /ASSEMBLY_ACC=CAM_ASM_000462 /TAXON_ID=3047 /ORGANISM="Dunaliella tertiolecta, Strain CCMP1320" /LENGTH=351 /DNA_ID=CAMNT_0048973597 /DNA_START=162 /DNA_END=1217 /DNA_ORIENTATION=+